MSALTQWFSPNVKPTHVGVYERRLPNGESDLYAYWNGTRWSVYASSVYSAMYVSALAAFAQDMEWRGLAEKPA